MKTVYSGSPDKTEVSGSSPEWPTTNREFTDLGQNLPTLYPTERSPRQNAQSYPDTTLLDLWGNHVRLSHFRGKTVFVNFWATWYPPYRAEVPEVEAIYQEFEDRDVVVIGVDILELKEVVLLLVQRGGYN